MDLDEGELAPHLDSVVRDFPMVRVGSYPRFSEKDFRVLVTLEAAEAGAVTAAFEMLVRSVGDKLVRSEAPAAVG